MITRTNKNLVAVLLGVVLSMGSLVWISGKRAANDARPVAAESVAQPYESSQSRPDQSVNSATQVAASQVNDSSASRTSSSDECYSAGYREGWRDALQSRGASVASSRARYSGSAYSAPRRRVAGATYYAERRRGHSTRDAILTVAAPAALGAGVGAIAGGKRGAGAGALIGGGAGALYYLIKRKH